MKLIRASILMFVIVGLISGCSSTTLTGSWKSPEPTVKISKIYIIGVSKNDTTRRIFEDSFAKSFSDSGITGVVSYKDFPNGQKADKDDVLNKAKENGVDTILLTKIIKKTTETVVNPGTVSTYSSGAGGYYPSSNHRSYGSSYSRRYETVYEPPTVSQFEIAIIESYIYDTATGALIWSAQLETMVGMNSQEIIDDFTEVVSKDLKDKGLI